MTSSLLPLALTVASKTSKMMLSVHRQIDLMLELRNQKKKKNSVRAGRLRDQVERHGAFPLARPAMREALLAQGGLRLRRVRGLEHVPTSVTFRYAVTFF